MNTPFRIRWFTLIPVALLALGVLTVVAAPAAAIPCEARCTGPSSLSCGCYEPQFAIITCSDYWYYGCPGRVAGPELDIEASRSATATSPTVAAQPLEDWNELTVPATATEIPEGTETTPVVQEFTAPVKAEAVR